MGSNKWRLPESLLLLCGLLLSLYLLRLPIALPSFLLPERVYIAFPLGTPIEVLRSAVGSTRVAFAILPDSLYRLPSLDAPAADWRRLQAALPDRPVFDALEAELARTDFPALVRVRLVAGFVPTAEELARLSAIAHTRGLPLSIRLLPPLSRPGIASYSWRTGELGEAFDFELLFSPESRRNDVSIEVRVSHGIAGSDSRVPTPDKKKTEGNTVSILWRGGGAALPPDRVLRLSTERKGLSAIDIDLSWIGGAHSVHLVPSVESSSNPRVLVIDGAKRGASFIDSLYPAKHLGPAEAQSIDPADWELIVDDGLPLKELGPSLSSRLAADARAGRTSLLFAADSAYFGRRGDNPALESVLPVTLLPPSLKDLPDMAVLILLDYSGSMYGGKLSLAKVTSLELLRGLKPGDRVGLLLFSDKRKWIWSFIPNQQIQAAPLLDPVEAEGGTELAPALMEGMDRLADTGPGEKHIVVISDGVTRPADFRAIAARARQKGITISTMGVGEDVNRPLLEKLAAESGGRFHLVSSADEIPALIFEDRKDQARPRFAEGRIAILDPAGTRVAIIGGMAQYAIRQGASTLYSNEVGDPLLAELDSGRRAVMLFASDLHGGFTGDFFANPSVAATLRDRLDSLFADRPRDIAVLETGREARVTLRSDALVAPSLELSRPGAGTRRLALSRRDGEAWEASVVLPDFDRWRATLEDRGTGLASFDLRLDDGVDGVDVPSARAAAAYRGSAFRILHEEGLWLLLFFASALGLSLAMRRRR